MKRNILYLFATFLFVSICINILANLQKFITFLPESAVFGPQIPYYEYNKDSSRQDAKRYSEGRYSDKEQQYRRYSYQNRWEDSQSNRSMYTDGRVKKGRYGNN